MEVSALSVFLAFVVFMGLLFVGLHISITMLLVGLGAGMAMYGMPFLKTVGSVVWSTQNSDILSCIPLFIMMGELLLRSRIADGMYKGMSYWLSGIPGGLLHTNIGTCALFACTTGSSYATAATVGTVSLPTLFNNGYHKGLALGSLAAGGTLGILIPPSSALLIYGSLTNNSISQLFVAGIIPGIILTVMFMVYIFIRSLFISPKPRVPQVTWGDRFRVLPDLVPPFVIFGIIMGSIYFGWATPTESASLGLVAAIGFALAKRSLSLEVLRTCFINTAQLTGMILLIVTCAMVLNLTLSQAGVPQVLTEWVGDMGLSFTSLMLLMVVVYIVLGMFLDVMCMQVATIPIAYPIVVAAGGDPIWFGIFIVIMSEMAMITPPMGMNLFVIQGVRRDGGPLSDVLWGTQPFALVMLVLAIVIIFYPEMVTYLPQRMTM